MKNIIEDAKSVDVNCMIGRSKGCAYKFESAKELEGQMRKCHISRALVGHFKASAWNMDDGNRSLCEELRSFPNLMPCFHLSSNLGSSALPPASKLKNILKKAGARAARVSPRSECYDLDSFYASDLLGMLDDLRLPLLVNWDELDISSLPRVCAEYKKIPFILLGAGFRKSRWMFPLLEKRDNVFFDICRFDDSHLLEEIITRFGAERLLFGSGMPLLSPGAAMTLVCYSETSDVNKKKILSGNWERIEKGIKL